MSMTTDQYEQILRRTRKQNLYFEKRMKKAEKELDEQNTETVLQFFWATLYKRQRNNLIEKIKVLTVIDKPKIGDVVHIGIPFYEWSDLLKLVENEGNKEGE